MNNERGIPIALYFVTPAAYFVEFLLWISFPQSYFLNGILGGLWTIGQVGILWTLYQLYRFEIYNGTRMRVLGVSIAAMGAISYITNYILGYWLSMNTRILLPMGALFTGIGMTVTGIQVIAAKRSMGMNRFAPLIVGLYPFLVMFPLLIITGHPSLTAIMAWGVPWMMLGYAMAFGEQLKIVRTSEIKNLDGRSPR